MASTTARVAIVTGAAQGIGESVALRLADDGLDIAVNDIPSKSDKIALVIQEIQKKGRRAIAIPGDVTSEEDVKNMVEKTVKELGGVDVMIANAGIGAVGPFLDFEVQKAQQIFDVNIFGVMLCFKYAALQMVKQGRGGRLIAASSGAGLRGIKNLSMYSASKFAVRGIAQTAALELREHKITVNVYAPGVIHTPLATGAGDADNSEPWDGGAKLKEAMGFPLDIPDAEPEVVSSIVSYLCKPEAYFISGQTINVDGGLYTH